MTTDPAGVRIPPLGPIGSAGSVPGPAWLKTTSPPTAVHVESASVGLS